MAMLEQTILEVVGHAAPASHREETLDLEHTLSQVGAILPLSKPDLEFGAVEASAHGKGQQSRVDTEVAWVLKQCTAMPRVEYSELGAMKLLGSGEYCTASATTLGGNKVAVKVLKTEKQANALALSDLQREVLLLARMQHENVITVVAYGKCRSALTASGWMPFICLEELASTLDADLPPPPERVTPWKHRAMVAKWPMQRALEVGLQVARALLYCHEHWMPGYRVLHRDLKPSNIGFTHSGRVVLFDFGLCRLWARAPPGEDDEDSLRTLTGMTGSLRYMAPEVALCKPYNHKAEVFSFTSLLFEVIAHQKPFFWMTPEVFIQDVCHDHRRCKLPKNVPPDVAKLMEAGWHTSPRHRPSFLAIVPVRDYLYTLLHLQTLLHRRMRPFSLSYYP